MTILEATIPCDMASPALRIAKILNAPPGTQNSPDTSPHHVKVTSWPSRITSQLVRLRCDNMIWCKQRKKMKVNHEEYMLEEISRNKEEDWQMDSQTHEALVRLHHQRIDVH